MAYTIKDRDEQIAASLSATLGIVITSELIALPIYSGLAALDLVYKWVPDIDSIPDNDSGRPYADMAIIAQIALNLLPYFRLNYFRTKQSPSLKTERFEPDWAALEERLAGDRDGALGELNPEYVETLSAGFNGFVVTHPPIYPPGGC